MDQAKLRRITEYVNENIDSFHTKRLDGIVALSLSDLLKRKNPYLFRAKNLTSASDLVGSILDAHLSSSEEGAFGHILEELAIFVSEITCGGQKSSTTGLDLELTRDGVRYLIAIKSGPNWGNKGQHDDLEAKFKAGITVLKQSPRVKHVQAILGCCYGKVKPTDKGLYIRLCGQSFWEFISGDANLYIDIIEPLGYEAKKHNENFLLEKDNTYNRFIRDFTNNYCDQNGQIDWPKLIQFNSGERQLVKKKL